MELRNRCSSCTNAVDPTDAQVAVVAETDAQVVHKSVGCDVNLLDRAVERTHSQQVSTLSTIDTVRHTRITTAVAEENINQTLMRALKDHDLPSAIDDDVLQLHESTYESLYPVQVVPEPRTFAEDDRSDDALITSEDFAFVEEELLGNTKSASSTVSGPPAKFDACGSAVNEVPISVAKEQLLSNPASLVYSEKSASHKSSLPSVTTSRESLTQLRKLRSPSGELQLRSVKYAVSRGIAGMNSGCRSRPQSSHSSALPTSVSRPRSSLSRRSATDQHLSAPPRAAKCAPTERQRGGVLSVLSQPKAQRVSSDSSGVSIVDGAPAPTPGKPAASDNRRRLSSGTKLPRACAIGTVTTVPHCIAYSRKRVDQSLATPGADAISKIPTKKPDQNKNKNPTVDRLS